MAGTLLFSFGGVSSGVMVKKLDSDIVVREFEIPSHYNVPLRSIPLGKVWTTLIHPQLRVK